MKVRLFDILDLSRPLAKAARDFDWTEVVNLFPEAQHEGLTAAKIWVLASVVVLSEVTGLSEGEVLSRWPENPYWQAFSGFEQFQWQTPATAADCQAFRRFISPARAARLSSIAQSIRESKPVPADITSPVPLGSGATVNEALALRQVHFSQPLPAAPYKAPPRPDFHSSVKHAYARSASKGAPESEAGTAADNQVADKNASSSGATAPGTAATPSESKPREETKEPAAGPDASPQRLTPVVSDSAFPQTYAQMFRNKTAPAVEPAKPAATPVVPPPAEPSPSKPAAVAPPANPAPAPAPAKPALAKPAPAAEPAPAHQAQKAQEAAAPQFDTTTPLVLRSPPGEPVRMEVNAMGGGAMEFQWEQWDDARGVAIPIEGCTESFLTVALEPDDSMLAFQCRVFNAAAPEGVISRTFFIKKITASQRTPNTFGEKVDPQMFGLRT